MLQFITAVLASTPLALASQSVFSVHDDLLAFPQYVVTFSNSYISDRDAVFITEHSSIPIHSSPSQIPNTNALEARKKAFLDSNADHVFDSSRETYELMWLNGEKHLCTIPIVEKPVRDVASETEARATEQKELARATDRGWELLKDLEGNCLYFISGWWSYSFCYNSEIVQFHQLAAQPGKPQFPPQRDPTTKEYVLGKAKTTHSREDEWGNQIDVHKEQKDRDPPKTELQVKGDMRYLAQKMEGGTICDLTNKPRQVEVQYHCNQQAADRIAYVKEVTTCSYLMVVYTARLCNDVAFLPPKELKANNIVCRIVVPENQLSYRTDLRSLAVELETTKTKGDKTVNIGGVVVGGGQWVGREGQRMPIPTNFGKENQGRVVEVIARAKAKANGGKVEMISDADLQKMDLDPEMMEQLKIQVQNQAGEHGWRIEVIDTPGQMRQILGIVDKEDDVDEESEGSEEVFKEEL